MTRAYVWCRVLGWLQIGGAVATGLCVYVLWSLFFGWLHFEDSWAFGVFMWIFIVILAFPPLLSGVLSLSFAGLVRQAQEGRAHGSYAAFRIVMALAGLWSAGAIGLMGLSLPPIGFFAVLGLATAAAAVMGHEWVADLFRRSESTA